MNNMLLAREQATLNKLTEAWNEYIRAHNPDEDHPDNLNDFRFHLHALQRILMAGPLWRAQKLQIPTDHADKL